MPLTDSIDRDALTEFLLRLVGAQSESTKEGQVAKILAQELDGFGFQVEVDDIGSARQ